MGNIVVCFWYVEDSSNDELWGVFETEEEAERQAYFWAEKYDNSNLKIRRREVNYHV
jgi:hypothetical protein